MAWWMDKVMELIAGKGGKSTSYRLAQMHCADRVQAFQRHCDESDKSSGTHNGTNDTTPTVTNSHGKRTAYFQDAVDDEDETATDARNRAARGAAKAGGTAPIEIVKPAQVLTDHEKILYEHCTRGSQPKLQIRKPGELKSDQIEMKMEYERMLRGSRERYELLVAKQEELPEEERMIDWRKKLIGSVEVW
ncbi:MAG: hypothetical protein LQ352_008380 [Teloschistes flavicans]|nr:MAG: hypothetical protein LQ352_008380 [Teloschistes flavicans]